MFEKVCSIIAGVLEVEPQTLSRESNSDTIPTWDSLNHWQIIEDIEQAFDVEFTMDEAVEFNTLGDLMSALEAAVGTKS